MFGRDPRRDRIPNALKGYRWVEIMDAPLRSLSLALEEPIKRIYITVKMSYDYYQLCLDFFCIFYIVADFLSFI